MADVTVPNVSFDWLAELPNLAEQSRLLGARRAALADLNSADPRSLDATIAKLMAAGDTETAIKLYQARTQRISAQQRSAEQEQYLRMLPSILGRAGATQAATQAAQSGFPPGVSPDAAVYGIPGGVETAPSTTPPAAAGAFPAPPPITPGGTTTVPPGLVPPGPQSALPAPPLSVAEKLQQGMPVQLAGPMPTPDTGPPPEAPGLPTNPPPWARGAQIPAPPTMPAASATRPTAPIGPGVPDQGAAAVQSALVNAYSLTPRAPQSAVNAARMQLQEAMAAAKVDPQVRMWHLDNLQRKQLGEPIQSFPDYVSEPDFRKRRFDAVMDAFTGLSPRGGGIGGYRTEQIKAQDVLGTIRGLEAIVGDRAFVSGADSNKIEKFASRLSTITGFARSLGIPENLIPDIRALNQGDGPARTAALQNAFNSLTNALVYKMTGGLGNQISNADREFIERIKPSLQNSVAGNMLLIKILRTTAEKAVKGGLAAAEYMSDKRPDRYKSVAGLDNYVRENASDSFAHFDPRDSNLPFNERRLVSSTEGQDLLKQVDQAMAESAPNLPPGARWSDILLNRQGLPQPPPPRPGVPPPTVPQPPATSWVPPFGTPLPPRRQRPEVPPAPEE